MRTVPAHRVRRVKVSERQIMPFTPTTEYRMVVRCPRAGGARQYLERQRRGRGGARVPDQLGAWISGLFRARGEVLVILLTGGTKQRQPRDIERAKALWAD